MAPFTMIFLRSRTAPNPIYSFYFFFNDTATTEIYTLSLHDALPIYPRRRHRGGPDRGHPHRDARPGQGPDLRQRGLQPGRRGAGDLRPGHLRLRGGRCAAHHRRTRCPGAHPPPAAGAAGRPEGARRRTHRRRRRSRPLGGSGRLRPQQRSGHACPRPRGAPDRGICSSGASDPRSAALGHRGPGTDRRHGRGRPGTDRGGQPAVNLSNYLVLASLLFAIGTATVLLRRNAIIVFMGVELMLNAANLLLVTFARIHGDLQGQVMAFFVMVVAAAEVVVGLAIIVSIFRARRSASVDDVNLLKN